ncbi:MerR family transcriptional regulator [Streptomyces mirabilis]|uniref:MerR family transcriptional regulator n=1 Tax=Streptomyces mirabilis TaxID=68239 RepID=UPI0036778FAA
MRIGELVRRTGATHRALRYYEEQGLLRPSRRPSGYREYVEEDVATVGRIHVLLAAGLGTAAIAEVLPCMAEERAEHASACAELQSALQDERKRIRSAIDDLTSALAMLDTVIASPHHLRRPQLRIMARPVAGNLAARRGPTPVSPAGTDRSATRGSGGRTNGGPAVTGPSLT